MAVLSSISPNEFIQCIHHENAALLTKLPGIGKKTAERLVVEMRDSIKQFGEVQSDSTHQQKHKMSSQDEAISALEALGYKPQEALKVVNKIDDGIKTCEQLIRESLQILSLRS
jgi:Holliday junction DNA helicase RuvA